MIDEPHITKQAARLAAALHLVIPRREIQKVMGPARAEVLTAIDDQGLKPAGPWFTHHLSLNPATFDFEVCVPIKSPIRPVGRVYLAEWPDMTVARTVYHGPYQGLGEAWGEFDTWTDRNGHRAQADLWECYLAGPESESDPDNWQTELSRTLL